MRLIGGPWYRSDAQRRITVVLLDDNYIEKIGAHWPLSYTDQELLLSDILSFRPKAVFIDLLYRHKHGTDSDIEQLTDTINQFSSKNNNDDYIPIFVPYLVKDIENLNSCDPANEVHSYMAKSIVLKNSVIEEIRQSMAVRTYIGWTGCGNRYPGFILRNPDYKTPALALYQSLCNDPHETLPGCEDIRSKGLSSFSDPMVIRWGTGVSKEHLLALKKADIECMSFPPQGFLSRIRYTWQQIGYMFGQSLSSTTERGKAERCAYTDTLHATWFLGSSPKLHTDLKNMIENRVILIGTQIEGIHDYVSSPVNGKLPGVYLFAMALDNYLQYGSDYYKELGDFLSALIEISAIISITLLMAFLWNRTCTMLSPPPTGLLARLSSAISLALLFKVIVPLFISILLAMAMWSNRYAPVDWIGILLLSFLANPVKLEQCLNRECTKKEPNFLCKCIETLINGGKST